MIYHPLHRVGDVLESINGINLTNADHRDAVRAVKETKKTLGIVSDSVVIAFIIHVLSGKVFTY